MRLVQILLLSLGLGLSFAAEACLVDSDCSYGSSCLKSDNDIYGICSKGSDTDSRPAQFVNEASSYGKSCQFDYQCGTLTCSKAGQDLYGVCR